MATMHCRRKEILWRAITSLLMMSRMLVRSSACPGLGGLQTCVERRGSLPKTSSRLSLPGSGSRLVRQHYRSDRIFPCIQQGRCTDEHHVSWPDNNYAMGNRWHSSHMCHKEDRK